MFELYQTPINTVAPPGYVHNKYKTVPCKNFLTEGHCKYGDRCTFAHGEHDIRAKFVPAEAVYPANPQTQVVEAAQVAQPGFETVDFGAFSPPPSSMGTTPAFAMQDPGQDLATKENGDYGSDSQLPNFDPNKMVDDFDQEPFFSSFNYKANGAGDDPMSGSSKPIKGPFQENNPMGLMSKFGFGYESLAENIDELELINNNKESVEKFSQAKYQIEMGNNEEGNRILNEMMGKEIRYKQYSNLENPFSSTFAPISE